jgi:hypothetical protein
MIENGACGHTDVNTTKYQFVVRPLSDKVPAHVRRRYIRVGQKLGGYI